MGTCRAFGRVARGRQAEEETSKTSGRKIRAAQATFALEGEATEATSGSVSHMTRLRPARFAA